MTEPRWEKTVVVGTAEQTHALGATLASDLVAGDLLVLTGELGSGKTTFTQGLGEGLGVRSGIISPTFVLVRIHPNLPSGPRPVGPDLVHVDAYRLESDEEIDGIDLENTLDSSVTVVEWGRGRVEHLSESFLDIELHRNAGSAITGPGHGESEAGVLNFDADDDNEPRTIIIRGYGPRWPEPPVLETDTQEGRP